MLLSAGPTEAVLPSCGAYVRAGPKSTAANTYTPAAMADLPAHDDFDPMGQFMGSAMRDPYPEFARLRRDEPVGFTNVFDMETFELIKAVIVYRFDDVDRVFRDNETFSSAPIRELMGPIMGEYVIVGLDEPEHKRHRNLVSQAFRQKSLAHWETDFVESAINDLIEVFAERGHAELVRELTFRYPVQVIAKILGIPPEEHDEFHQHAIAIVQIADDPERGIAASQAMKEYLQVIVDDRRANPGDDVISDLVQTELDGERLDDEEIFSFLRLLLPAGAETTYRATGNLLYALLTHPEQLDALRRDRSLAAPAIEEAIRWETPLLITSRRATVDTELGGIEVPVGMQVVPNIGSANHDETRWERADEFDLFRTPKPHISFATGVHMCLGMHLARMEMRTAINVLLDRLPGLRLDPDRVDADDVHIHGEQFRSPTSLPVIWN
jgi:cytochrome P450